MCDTDLKLNSVAQTLMKGQSGERVCFEDFERGHLGAEPVAPYTLTRIVLRFEES